MAKKIIIEVEIDKMLGSDTDWTIELADKIQENIIESATKTIKKWNRWNSGQIKTISLNSKVE
jgi:hypothetical protein